MTKSIYLFLVSTVILACNPAEKKNDPKDAKPIEKTVGELIDNTKISVNEVATLQVEGMSCVMGCGSLIRKKLYETGAVAQCDFDFVTDRKVNTVKVSFNNESLSALEIQNIITKIEESDFEARLLNSEPNIKESEDTEDTNDNKQL